MNNLQYNPSNNSSLQNSLFGTIKLKRNTVKGKFIYKDWERASMEPVHGVLVMTLLGMLYFLVLIIVHTSHANNWKNTLVLAEGPTDDINDSIDTTEIISSNLTKLYL